MQEKEIELSEIIGILLKRVWMISALAALGALVALLVNCFTTPQYKASALLMINPENAGKLETSPYASFMAEEDYYRTQYKLLESRSLLADVYEKMHLNQYEQFAGPNPLKKLQNAIKIEPVTRSRLVEVSATAYDPHLAQQIANTLVNTFVTDNITSRVSMGQDVIAALESTEKSHAQQELLNSMPQYQKAVIKSRFVQAKTLGNALSKAEELYYLANGVYTDHLEDLSIDLPMGVRMIGESEMEYPWGKCYIACDDYKCGGCALYGPNKTRAVIYFFSPWGKRHCYVSQDAPAVYNELCKSETGKSTGGRTGTNITYRYD